MAVFLVFLLFFPSVLGLSDGLDGPWRVFKLFEIKEMGGTSTASKAAFPVL